MALRPPPVEPMLHAYGPHQAGQQDHRHGHVRCIWTPLPLWQDHRHRQSSSSGCCVVVDCCRRHGWCFQGPHKGSTSSDLQAGPHDSCYDSKDSGESFVHVLREVAAVRVHSLADASHGQPLTVETKSPKALGVTRVHSLVTPTQTESRSVSVRSNVVPRWHGSSQQSATAKCWCGLFGQPLSITAPWRLGHIGQCPTSSLLATTKAFDQGSDGWWSKWRPAGFGGRQLGPPLSSKWVFTKFSHFTTQEGQQVKGPVGAYHLSTESLSGAGEPVGVY